METRPLVAIHAPNWPTIGFFALVHTGAIGAIFYILSHTISPAMWALTVFYIFATGMSITVGYHRLFSHRAFKAHPLIQFLVLFFGAAAFEMSALGWSAQHRTHHKYVDTEKDPYNIKQGFFYAHMGWMIFWIQPIDYSNAKDLQENKMVDHQDGHYGFWSLMAGILLPTLLGALLGDMIAGFLLVFCARAVFVYHSTFLINSASHMYGKGTYDYEGSAKDNWFTAILTFGEGYHSFHHRFPSDYRNGVRWFAYDPSKWFIYVMQFFGLTSDLIRIPNYQILRARLVSEKQYMLKHLNTFNKWPEQEKALELLRQRYEHVLNVLHEWEQKLKSYNHLPELQNQMNAEKWIQLRAQIYRSRFDEAYENWQEFVDTAKSISHLSPSLQKLLKLSTV